MVKNIKIVIVALFLLIPSYTFSTVVHVGCNGYYGYCVPDCCLGPIQCNGPGCSMGGCAVEENGQEKGYLWYYDCPMGFPEGGCDWFANHNWQLGYPSCGLYAPMCGQRNSCNLGKYWALCGVTYTCDNSRNIEHDGHCYYGNEIGGNYIGDICTQEVYGGYGCYAIYQYCLYEPAPCENCGSGCELHCEYPQVPDSDCLECHCPAGNLECAVDMEFVSAVCDCACKNVPYEQTGNMNVSYKCSEKQLVIAPDIPLYNYLEVYMELYRCRGQGGGGGGDMSEIFCGKAYAEDCGQGWEFIMSSYDGLTAGTINVDLQEGLYRLVTVFYRSPGCWQEGTQKYNEKFFYISCCSYSFNSDRLELLKQTMFERFPFSMIQWAIETLDFESISASSLKISMPVVGDIEIKFTELYWLRLLILAGLCLEVASFVIRRIR